jgi:hypothetical protein
VGHAQRLRAFPLAAFDRLDAAAEDLAENAAEFSEMPSAAAISGLISNGTRIGSAK